MNNEMMNSQGGKEQPVNTNDQICEIIEHKDTKDQAEKQKQMTI